MEVVDRRLAPLTVRERQHVVGLSEAVGFDCEMRML